MRSAIRAQILSMLVLTLALLPAFVTDERPPPTAPIFTPTGIHGDARDVIKLDLVGAGFAYPSAITSDGSDRIFVAEQIGRIRRIENGVAASEPFLDITSRVFGYGELGLVGLAFHPEFQSNGRFYISYADNERQTVLSEWTTDDGQSATMDSERIVLVIPHASLHHMSGNLVFGPDGFLYMGVGDDNRAGQEFSPDLNRLNGSIIRVDVDSRTGDLPYGIPPDNPFADGGGRPELYDIGLRNPWGISFDPFTGDMYFADPGGTNWEEVNRHEVDDPPGLNFGWGVMEGSHCRIDGCDQHGLVPPIAEYLGSGAGRGDCAIIGGLISRPPARDIQNRYVFGDLCSGRIRSLDVESLSGELLLDTDLLISAFGMDETGSIYVGDHPTGRIYRIVDQHAGPEPSGSDP